MMNLNDMIAAAEDLRDVMGDVLIDSISSTANPELLVFNLKPGSQKRVVYNMKNCCIVQHYSDTWRNPWHKTVIREAK